MYKFTIAALLVALSGCAIVASNPDDLARETAKSIPGGFKASDINVSNIDRGMKTVTWLATSPKGTFTCDADDMVRRVTCSPK